MDNDTQNTARDERTPQPDHRHAGPSVPPTGQLPPSYHTPFLPQFPPSYHPSQPPYGAAPSPIYPQYVGQSYSPAPYDQYAYPASYPYQGWWYPDESQTQTTMYSGQNTFQNQPQNVHDAAAYFPQPPPSFPLGPPTPSVSRPSPSTIPPPPPRLASSLHDDNSRPDIRRTAWVMWVGNLPSKATHIELQKFLDRDDDSGVASVFVISQSNCAFVNFEDEEALLRGIDRNDGQQLRPDNPRCPRLVCRIRLKEDDYRAGVGGQRSARIHKEAVRREQGNVAVKDFASLSLSESAVEQLDVGLASLEPSERPVASRTSTDGSTDSTSSSFLSQHFPRRFFILKSFTAAELDESVQTNTWNTQVHNEEVLDRAFRTSQEVILIFSENRSGAFYGFARMMGPANVGSAAFSEDIAVSHLQDAGRASSLPVESLSERARRMSRGSQSLDGTSLPVPLDVVASHVKGKGVISRDDALRSSSEMGPAPRGRPFPIQWISTERLSFKRTRHITNVWAEGREVKISRDGTELHPDAGKQLLEAWEKLAAESNGGSSRKRRGQSDSGGRRS